MCCQLQRHEINSIKILFTNETILKKLLQLFESFFTPIRIFLNEFISKTSLEFIFLNEVLALKKRE